MRRKQGNGKSMLNDSIAEPCLQKKKRCRKKIICKKGDFLFTKTGQDKTSRRCVWREARHTTGSLPDHLHSNKIPDLARCTVLKLAALSTGNACIIHPT